MARYPYRHSAKKKKGRVLAVCAQLLQRLAAERARLHERPATMLTYGEVMAEGRPVRRSPPPCSQLPFSFFLPFIFTLFRYALHVY